jgi:exopolysaccharide biosynthesis polyprenyl glycosylphosphotransferase
MGQAERNKRGTWVQAFWHLSDILAIGLGFFLGYWTRFSSPLAAVLPPEKGIPPLSQYLIAALISALIWIPLMHAGGLYRLDHGRPRHRRADLLRVQLVGMLVMAALSFFYRDASFSRLAVPLIWFYTVVLTVGGRATVQAGVRRWSRRYPIRFAVVGRGAATAAVVNRLLQSPYPHQFLGFFAGNGPAASTERDRAEPDDATPGPLLGQVGEIGRIGEKQKLDLVVLAAPAASSSLLQEVYQQCQQLDLDFLFVPELFSLWAHPVRIEDVDGLPVIRLRELSLVGWNGVLKRTLDLLVSIPLMVLLAPVFLGLAAAVWLEDRGSVFHGQERVGRDRRTFAMLKFRSMRVNAEEKSGPVWAAREDPRRTRVGTFLRKWSLDELPQLWNVLRGEMSLVGPRPERPFFVHQFEDRVSDYYDRHRVKAGMTGWAQVHGLRGDTPIEDRTRYDLYYVENWSIWLDLRILALTLRAVLKHRGT